LRIAVDVAISDSCHRHSVPRELMARVARCGVQRGQQKPIAQAKKAGVARRVMDERHGIDQSSRAVGSDQRILRRYITINQRDRLDGK
jgi:hypothetical protein